MVMVKRILNFRMGLVLGLGILVPASPHFAVSFSPFAFLETFSGRLSLSRLWNMILLETINITHNMHLVQAKKLFKKSGHSSELECLQQQAINEYAKAKAIDCRQLSIVDYHGVKSKDLLGKIPYALSAEEFVQLLTPDEDGGTYVHKQKFLIDNGIPVGWIDYCYYQKPDGIYDNGHIHFVGVAKKHRGKHYGTYLMGYALQEMLIVGVQIVGLHAANAAAAQFHKKIGFEVVSPSSLAMQRKIPGLIWPFSLFA